MRSLIFISLFLMSAMSFAAKTPAALLSVEKKYQSAKTVQMDVSKKLRIPLLEKVRISEGSIKIKKGGKFKWEVTKPEHSLILLTPEAVWAIDYPLDEKDKISVIKSRKPKKNQSPAIVTFLMGQGSLSKNFKVKSSASEGDLEKTELEAKSKNEAVKNMTVNINKKEIIIEKISFEDSMGNQTELEFKNIQFDMPLDKNEFKLKLPKDADINVVD